jgi:G3E family GTPase
MISLYYIAAVTSPRQIYQNVIWLLKHIMRNTTILSMVAVVTVAILVAGIAATTVSGVNMAFANKGGDKIKQTKVVVLNKCANVDDKNKDTDIKNVRCEINRDSISGTGFPLLDGNIRVD